MRWDLDNPGGSAIIAGYEHHGVDVPDALIPPDLHDVEHSLWAAFSDLSTERGLGMDTGPIPWSSVVAYHAYSDPGIDIADFVEIIKAMDGAYLSHKPEG